MTRDNIIVGFIMTLIIGLCALWIVANITGCKSQKAKPTATMEERIEDEHEVDVETTDVVEGDGNELVEITDNSKSTEINTTKLLEQITQQNQNSQGVTADKIEELKTSINNTNNSTILMIILNAFLVVIILVLIGILFWIIRKFFSLSNLMNAAIASDKNNLTTTKLDALKLS